MGACLDRCGRTGGVPGWQRCPSLPPWHTHPGPALASVTGNELVYIYADDCEERPYPEGTAFVDPGGDNIHTAYNPSETEETTVTVTFLGVPEEGPLTLPVDEDEGAALDEQCRVDF